MRLYLPNGMLKREADVDVSDLTSAQRTGPAYWDEGDTLVLPFDTEPTPTEQAAIERRLTTDDDVDEDRQTQVDDALQTLANYGDLKTTPPTATTVAVVKLLCKVTVAQIEQRRRRGSTD